MRQPHFTIRPTDRLQPCPCGSGAHYRRCCAEAVRAARRSPPGDRSGLANTGCYAHSLNDCCDQLSREHPVSEAVLARFTNEGNLSLENAPWVGAGQKLTTSPPNLAARVLCRRHNSGLSELDQVGASFIKRLELIDRIALGDRREPSVELFNGQDLERWFLKLLAGTAAAGWGIDGKVSIPSAWCDVIWGSASVTEPNGLYLITAPVEQPSVYRYDLLHEGFFVAKQPQGLRFSVHGFVFELQMGPGFDVRQRWGRFANYRPTHLKVDGPHATLLTEIDYGDSSYRFIGAKLTGSISPGRKPDAWGWADDDTADKRRGNAR